MKFIVSDSLESIRRGTDYLWDSVRGSFTGLDRLRRILGHVGRTDMLDHFREKATGVPQPLDLPDDIIRMVSVTRDVVSWCKEIIACEPWGTFRNFDRLQAAAPGLLAAMRLETSWAAWHEYHKTDPGAREEARDVHELLVRGTALGFLVQTMADFYFRIWTYENEPADFLQLFPPTDDWSPELAASFQLIAACHIATYFLVADEYGMPDRPDLICRVHYMLRQLKKDILDGDDSLILGHAAEYGFLQELTMNPEMIESEPDLESFYREQRSRHFADFTLPPADEEGDAPDVDEA